MDVRPTDSHWPSDLPRVAIIGAGRGGLDLTEMALHFGHPTSIVDTDPSKLKRARERVRDRLERHDAQGLLHTDVDAFLEGLTTTESLEEVTEDADVIVEALPEDLKLKQGAFNKLSNVPGEPIMATATSLFSVEEVSEGNPAPERMVGTHFYEVGRPMPIVEIIPGPSTSEDVVSRAQTFVRGLGKEAVTLEKDAPGFVATRVLSRLFAACASAAENGNAGEIDAGFREIGFPMGPFALMDQIGLDRVAEVEGRLTGEVPKPLEELVAEEKLGRKTREGWFDASGPPTDVEPADPWPLMASMFVEAATVVEEGFTSALQVDRLLRLGANVPGGPFQLIQHKGLEEVVELAEDADLDPSPLDSVDLPEINTGVEVRSSGDVTLIRFTQNHRNNVLDEGATDAFASAVWDADGPVIVAGEGEYFMGPKQSRVDDETLDALRKSESVAVLHGPLGDGAMSVGRACRRRVARVDAAIGIDRPVPATRAVQLELVDAVAHPLWMDKAVSSVLSQVTTVPESVVADLLTREGS